MREEKRTAEDSGKRSYQKAVVTSVNSELLVTNFNGVVEQEPNSS